MALAPLATVADLDARGVTVADTETNLVETYLAVASAAVRDAAGVPISKTTSTVTIEGEMSARLRLPGPPIASVDTVVLDGQTITDWLLRSGQLWRQTGWSDFAAPSEVTVTYTHGLPEVPADIVDLVCRIATTTLVSYRSQPDGEGLAAEDVRRERIGDYSVAYGTDGQITEMELSDQLRSRLAARFGGGAGMVVTR